MRHSLYNTCAQEVRLLMRCQFFFFLFSIFFVSCSEDYSDWGTPQQNSQNEPASQDVTSLSITPSVTGLLDFAAPLADTIVLCTAAEQYDYSVVLTNPSDAAESVSLPLTWKASPEGEVGGGLQIATEDLAAAIRQLYGRAPYERTLQAVVTASVKTRTADGEIAYQAEAAPFTFKAKLVAPVIASAYYLVGSPTDGMTADEMKFQHSTADVYDDPVFTYVFQGDGGSSEWGMWYVVVDADNMNGKDIKDWNAVYGPSGDSFATEGTFNRRSTLGWEASFKVDGTAPYYRLSINMMELTYTVEPLTSIN